MVVLEAARAIAQSGVKPRRTIRFILFGAEEEGLIGSAAYAAQHAAEMDKVQAVLVLDNGTGMITGQALQGRDQDQQLWTDPLAPVNSLGATMVRSGNKGGTDHLSFIQGGGHGGSHPHMVNEFVTALTDNRDPWPNAVQSADWTCVGICAHQSAEKGGEIVRLPAFTLK